MAIAEHTLPHWDMTPLFPALESAAFDAAFTGVREGACALRNAFDAHSIRGGAPADAYDELTSMINEFHRTLEVVDGYIHSFVSTDAANDLAQARASELDSVYVELAKLDVRYEAWVGSLDVEALLASSQIARDHEFSARKCQTGARHQMSEPEEDLAASLGPNGSSAWAKLHSNITARLEVELDGEMLPMSVIRGKAHDPSADVRRAAYDAEIGAWQGVAVPVAAALNSIKGWGNVVLERRKWADPVEPALERNNIDRATLEAMQAACAESFPDFRRYLRAKAKMLGHDGGLPWWDLFAPVGSSDEVWPYDRATSFIVDRFGSYSQRMSDFADRAFRENWIDAEPRAGKVQGAFCMEVRAGESRILANFEPSFDSVSTLAHELGHGYHNLCLRDRTPIQLDTPMTLAETASIFCETIIMSAAIADATGDGKLYLLENDIQGACQLVVDIHSRFLFETSVFSGRRDRELSVDELNTAMLDAQHATYGDGLDSGALHPFMWAVKGHYYGSSYYNFPYTFGMLFGVGLYAQYQADPDRFRAGYDDLLSSTGLADAATLAARFGIDIRSIEFWRSSLDVIRPRIDEFVALVG